MCGSTSNYVCNDSTTYDTALGVLPSAGATSFFIPSAGDYGLAVGSFSFTINQNEPVGQSYNVSYQSTPPPYAFAAKDSAISRCKGDFTGKGIPGGIACFKHGSRPTEGIDFSIGGTGSGCVLEKTGTYYLNIRGQTPGEPQGVVL